MVIVELVGGLGNQMFQYAAGRALAERFQVPLKVDTNWFSLEHGGTKREYALNHLQINSEIASPVELAEFVAERNWWNKARNFWCNGQGKRSAILCEAGFSFDARVMEAFPPLYLRGYWQSEKYFLDIAAILRKEFRVKHLSDSSRQVCDRIRNENAVSLHIRRGDYATDPATQQFHGCCSLDYYREAVNLLQTEMKDMTVFVFSDDLSWAKENLQLQTEVFYVDVEGGAQPQEELELMRECEHHIIANSSFSWWGAWLNEKSGKKVIAPKKWFANAQHDTKDLIPETWIRL